MRVHKPSLFRSTAALRTLEETGKRLQYKPIQAPCLRLSFSSKSSQSWEPRVIAVLLALASTKKCQEFHSKNASICSDSPTTARGGLADQGRISLRACSNRIPLRWSLSTSRRPIIWLYICSLLKFPSSLAEAIAAADSQGD